MTHVYSDGKGDHRTCIKFVYYHNIINACEEFELFETEQVSYSSHVENKDDYDAAEILHLKNDIT